MTADDELDRVRAALREPGPRRDRTGPGASAVLAPLVPGKDGPRLLFTRRAATLPNHAGEVSFPGGRIEPGEDALEAALRETEEEIGVAPRDVEVLGHVTDMLTHRDFVVSAFAALVAPAAVRAPPVPNLEVDEVLLVRVRDLREARAGSVRAASAPRTKGPQRRVLAYEARHTAGGPQAERLIHYWALEGGPVLWGITGHLVAALLERAFGWRPPAPPRTIRRREDVLP